MRTERNTDHGGDFPAVEKNRTEAAQMTATEELNAIDGAELFATLEKMAYTAAKKATAKGYNFARIIRTADDLATAAAEAFTTLPADAEKAEQNGEPLAFAAYRAAWKALKRLYRAEQREAAAVEQIDKDAEGHISARVTVSASTAADYTTAAVDVLDAIERAQKDSIDAAIIAGLRAGLDRADVAAMLGVSRQAVERRLQNIRRRMSE